jgi:hypothetical protein
MYEDVVLYKNCPFFMFTSMHYHKIIDGSGCFDFLEINLSEITGNCCEDVVAHNLPIRSKSQRSRLKPPVGPLIGHGTNRDQV